LKSRIDQVCATQIAEEDSPNWEIFHRWEPEVQKSLSSAVEHLTNAATSIDAVVATAEQLRAELAEVHAIQTAEFTELQKVHQQADERSRMQLDLQQRVARLEETEAEQAGEKERLAQLLEGRRTLKARFLLEREQISALRDTVAGDLTREAGDKIRVRVLRNADDLAYRNLLMQGLKGAGVRNHDEILDSLLQLRPEQLAQLIQTDDHVGFDEACGFGPELYGQDNFPGIVHHVAHTGPGVKPAQWVRRGIAAGHVEGVIAQRLCHFRANGIDPAR